MAAVKSTASSDIAPGLCQRLKTEGAGVPRGLEDGIRVLPCVAGVIEEYSRKGLTQFYNVLVDLGLHTMVPKKGLVALPSSTSKVDDLRAEVHIHESLEACA